MKNFVILLVFVGLVYPCITVPSFSSLGNDSWTNLTSTITCITALDTNSTISFDMESLKLNNVVLLDNFASNYTDAMRNTTVGINKNAIDNSYKRNDRVIFPITQEEWNNVTFTTYAAYVPAQTIYLNSSENRTVNNITMRCAPIPATYCHRNVSLTNVSGYNDSFTNVSVDCQMHVNKTLVENEEIHDTVHDVHILPFTGYKKNLTWHLGMGAVQIDQTCNITAYGASLESLRTNNSYNLNFGDTSVDALSGNRYTAPSVSTCPWKQKNVSLNLTAPENYSDADTGTYLYCKVSEFPTNQTYEYDPNATSKNFALTSLDFFNRNCNPDETKDADLAGCVNRLRSPEVWTDRLNQTQTLADNYQEQWQSCQKDYNECKGVLDSGNAFMDKFWYFVIAVVIGIILGVMFIIGFQMYRKQNLVASRPTTPPTVGGNVVHIEDYGKLGTPPSAKDTNRILLPKGYKEL